MEKFKKSEMVAAIAEHADITKKDAEKFLDVFYSVLATVVREGKDVSLQGVGILKPRMSKETRFNMFDTGTFVTKPARMKLRFTVAKELKDFFDEQAGI